jgi:hypothetical protein
LEEEPKNFKKRLELSGGRKAGFLISVELDLDLIYQTNKVVVN